MDKKSTVAFITLCATIILLSISLGVFLPKKLVQYLIFSKNSRFYKDSRESSMNVDYIKMKNLDHDC